MTERTGGKTFDYKLLHTTGERKEVIRTRPTEASSNPIHEAGSLSEAESSDLVRTSTPTHTTASFDFGVNEFSGEDSVTLASVTSQLESLTLSSGEETSTLYCSTVVKLTDSTVVEKMTDTQDPAIQEGSIADDIDDFIDENPLDDIKSSIPDLDTAINSVENLRSLYRNKHKESVDHVGTGNYNQEEENKFKTRLDVMKKYILSARASRKLLRKCEGDAKTEIEEQKKRKLKFLGDEIARSMTDLETKFSVELKDKTNDEVSRLKNDLSQLSKDIQSVAKTIQAIVEAGETAEIVEVYEDRYKKLLTSKISYDKSVISAFDSREIEKQKTFKTSLLSIKLPKFKGYESSLDIYSFQDKFEKLHLRDTPTESLADLLKNNYLENPAQMLVKDVSSIGEIWKRLKEAYGDHQILLSKKLEEFNKFESQSKPNQVHQKNKISGPAKTVELLSKVINLMKDLVGLAQRHDIENHLYYGDGLTRIYRLLSPQCRRRWLELACDITTEQGKWTNLLAFLEKELKVSQQEAIIMTKSSSARQGKDDGPPSKRGADEESHYGGQPLPPGSKVCLVCGESDHVQTNGPRGMKLVQYVACKYFAEMRPAERFQFLKSKGYCAQCLFRRPCVDDA